MLITVDRVMLRLPLGVAKWLTALGTEYRTQRLDLSMNAMTGIPILGTLEKTMEILLIGYHVWPGLFTNLLSLLKPPPMSKLANAITPSWLINKFKRSRSSLPIRRPSD
jgi:hypothetical protein